MSDQDDAEREITRVQSAGGPFVAAIARTRTPTLFIDPNLPDAPVVYANDAFLRMTGHAREEVLGRGCDALIGIEEGAAVRRTIEASLDHGVEGLPEIRYHRKDGSFFWASLLAGIVPDADGRVANIFLSFIDVSRQREADLLLLELDHRVNNILATVQALAAATLRSPEVREERAAFQGRLRALADAHALLARRTWEGAGLRELIDRILKPFLLGDDGAARVFAPGEEVRVGPKQAQSLGLMFQELATNATKYGALSNGTGRIDIAWERSGAPEPRLRLRWTESGGPPVVPPPARGFGSRLIEHALPSSLGGSAHLTFEPGGLVCEIEIGLDAGA